MLVDIRGWGKGDSFFLKRNVSDNRYYYWFVDKWGGRSKGFFLKITDLFDSRGCLLVNMEHGWASELGLGWEFVLYDKLISHLLKNGVETNKMILLELFKAKEVKKTTCV